MNSGVFEIVVMIEVQNVFRLEMHRNKKIYILKIIFNINILKHYENMKKKTYFKQKNKNLIALHFLNGLEIKGSGKNREGFRNNFEIG